MPFTMRGRSTAQAAFAILRANILQLHMRLEVELDHGQGGEMSGAGCPPSESLGAKADVQTTVIAIFNRFTR